MATAKKAKVKKGAAPVGKTAAKTRKASTVEQIEMLEKALEKTSAEDATDLLPEDVKADIEANKKELDALETPEEINLDEEVRKIFETVEPSDEIKEQLDAFENGKAEFSEKIGKEPEKAEEIVQDEIKRIEGIKKSLEAIKTNLTPKPAPRRVDNEGFTNWWNGASDLF